MTKTNKAFWFVRLGLVMALLTLSCGGAPPPAGNPNPGVDADVTSDAVSPTPDVTTADNGTRPTDSATPTGDSATYVDPNMPAGMTYVAVDGPSCEHYLHGSYHSNQDHSRPAQVFVPTLDWINNYQLLHVGMNPFATNTRSGEWTAAVMVWMGQPTPVLLQNWAHMDQEHALCLLTNDCQDWSCNSYAANVDPRNGGAPINAQPALLDRYGD